MNQRIRKRVVDAQTLRLLESFRGLESGAMCVCQLLGIDCDDSPISRLAQSIAIEGRDPCEVVAEICIAEANSAFDMAAQD